MQERIFVREPAFPNVPKFILDNPLPSAPTLYISRKGVNLFFNDLAQVGISTAAIAYHAKATNHRFERLLPIGVKVINSADNFTHALKEDPQRRRILHFGLANKKDAALKLVGVPTIDQLRRQVESLDDPKLLENITGLIVDGSVPSGKSDKNLEYYLFEALKILENVEEVSFKVSPNILLNKPTNYTGKDLELFLVSNYSIDVRHSNEQGMTLKRIDEIIQNLNKRLKDKKSGRELRWRLNLYIANPLNYNLLDQHTKFLENLKDGHDNSQLQQNISGVDIGGFGGQNSLASWDDITSFIRRTPLDTRLEFGTGIVEYASGPTTVSFLFLPIVEFPDMKSIARAFPDFGINQTTRDPRNTKFSGILYPMQDNIGENGGEKIVKRGGWFVFQPVAYADRFRDLDVVYLDDKNRV